jgi:hypothetical protein
MGVLWGSECFWAIQVVDDGALGPVVLLEDVLWLGMVTDDEWNVLLGVGGVVDVSAGFWDVETCWDELGDETRLLDRRSTFRRDPACSNEETAWLDMPACSSSCGSAGSVSCVLGHPCTSFDVVYIISELVGTFWSQNMAWFDVLDVVVEAGDAVVVDDEAVEWRRTGCAERACGLERGTVGCALWVGSEFRLF